MPKASPCFHQILYLCQHMLHAYGRKSCYYCVTSQHKNTTLFWCHIAMLCSLSHEGVMNPCRLVPFLVRLQQEETTLWLSLESKLVPFLPWFQILDRSILPTNTWPNSLLVYFHWNQRASVKLYEKWVLSTKYRVILIDADFERGIFSMVHGLCRPHGAFQSQWALQAILGQNHTSCLHSFAVQQTATFPPYRWQHFSRAVCAYDPPKVLK